MWEKVKNIIKKEFDSEPVYDEKYLKAKIKSYNGKINTNFHNNKIPKEVSQFICLSAILIDHVMLILINQHLLNVVFSMTKTLNGQSSPKQNFHSPHLSMRFGKPCFS